MPNATFEPLTSCQGQPAFVGLDLGPRVPSALGVNYCLVQCTDPLTSGWRTAIEGAPATILEVHPQDALLVSLPDDAQCSTLLSIPSVRAVCPYLPSHAPFGQWTPLFDPVSPEVPSDLIDDDGTIRLLVGLHVGEDPAAYIPALNGASFSCTLTGEALRSPLPAASAAPGQLRVHIAAGASAACVKSVVEWLSRLEATEVVLAQRSGRSAMDATNWLVQTGLAPPAPPALPYGPTTTKLFANGITGAGQVVAIADEGMDNDSCALTYGPHLSDVTPGLIDPNGGRFLPPWAATSGGSTNPNDLVIGLAPGWRPRNKVVANYCFAFQPTLQGGSYFDVDTHGTVVAACAAGDDHRVSAARAGSPTDNPFEDEVTPDQYGVEIDHHQLADGAAPGAQVIVQKVQGFAAPSPATVVDMLRQAYDTEPGARAHSNSSGEYLGSGVANANAANFYGPRAAEADSQLFRLRDLVMTFAAGNPDIGKVPPDSEFAWDSSACKSCISVAATKGAPDVVAGGGMMDNTTWPAIREISGHGPGFPFQIKPDVSVPGQGLTMHASSLVYEDGTGSGDGGCTYLSAGAGTSVAAPTVAGLALDVRQYFVDGYYGGGAPNPSGAFTPTNALVKAVLINSTRNITGDFTGDTGDASGDRPSYGQGWGVVTLDDTLRFVNDTGDFPERKLLFVLNDVPNGLKPTDDINDLRPEVLDDFRPAIRDGQVHEFELWAQSNQDLHVTLAWSDVEGNPGALTPAAPCTGPLVGQPPLRNDLDLEIIDPAGKVWRPRPGGWCASTGRPLAGTDSSRLWQGGYSVLGSDDCPAGCVAAGQPEQDHPQGAPPFCDFNGRDRSGTVENIFIPALNVIPVSGVNAAPYRVRVIGYDVQGNGRTDVEARPNFVVNDESPTEYDNISDLDQGYALIASGDVMTEHGHLEFTEPFQDCSNPVKLILTTTVSIPPLVAGAEGPDDPTVGRITVTAAGGDCDEFELVFREMATTPGGTSTYDLTFNLAPLPAVIDPVLFGCGSTRLSPSGQMLAGDGVVQVADDGWVSGRLTFPGVPAPMASISAGSRVTCRDVELASSAGAVLDDGCDDMANGALNPGELAWLDVTLTAGGSASVTTLTGNLLPKDRNVMAVPTSVVFTTVAPSTLEARILLRADAALGGINCPSSVEIELELTGEDGFRDRVFLDVPVDCALDVTPPLARPGEVPGLPTTDSVRVSKQVSDPAIPSQMDLLLTWGAAPQPIPTPVPPYTYSYDIWEGSLRGLHRLGYTHVLPDTGFGSNPFCHQSLPGPTPLVLLGRATWGEQDSYYLVTARVDCPSSAGSLDGPWGHPDRDADGVDDAEEIPAGRRLACP